MARITPETSVDVVFSVERGKVLSRPKCLFHSSSDSTTSAISGFLASALFRRSKPLTGSRSLSRRSAPDLLSIFGLMSPPPQVTLRHIKTPLLNVRANKTKSTPTSNMPLWKTSRQRAIALIQPYNGQGKRYTARAQAYYHGSWFRNMQKKKPTEKGGQRAANAAGEGI